LQRIDDTTTELIKRELAVLAHSDITNYLDFGPRGVTLKDSKSTPKHLLKAIVGVTCHKSESDKGSSKRISLKLWDKPKVLELLDKIYHMLTEKRELSGPGVMPQT
jgi:hypothetical protein